MQATAPNEILEKIRKLRALAEDDPDAPECANAAAVMSRLLLQHNLSLADIETEERRDRDDYERRDEETGRDRWRAQLLHVIASSNFCRAVKLSGTKSCALVGRPHNVEVVVYMYAYLARELDRLASAGWLASEERKWGDASARTWKNSFLMGAVRVIDARLHEQRRADTANSQQSAALIRVVDVELDDAIKTFFGRVYAGRGSQSRIDREAYVAGREAGRSIGLNQGLRGGANASGRRLLGGRA